MICHTYGGERTPILALVADGTHLTIADGPTLPLEEHLRFARRLVDGAAAYLAAVEHYAAARVDLTKAA
ncbi:hypothetical protein DMB38_18410 [Streptomyces sp. WAC 06738]|uniref:hypothetical protein n=1 Tax=Streptomyces sp. WAC 06738 TaxID=2203210 RepID=UPI000F704EA3|nr:hypothetical protein [Streptomyces sp. WAC 06738]AZM47501.1 hypothetical protein DMB38_18410 [Streptomyces sp. WAC 06738]